MKTKYKYIHFGKIDLPGKKTSLWECFSNRSDFHLGTVKWYGAWRQYCFFPSNETVFNKGCMDNIGDFIQQLMDERKK